MLNEDRIKELTSEANDLARCLQHTAEEYKEYYNKYKKVVDQLNRESQKLNDYDLVEVKEYKRTMFYGRLEVIHKEIHRVAGMNRVVDTWIMKSYDRLRIAPPTDSVFPSIEVTNANRGVDLVKKSHIDKFLREQRVFLLTHYTADKVSNAVRLIYTDIKGSVIGNVYSSKMNALEDIETLKRTNIIDISICLNDHYIAVSIADESFLKVWECTDEELLNMKALYDL